MARGETLYSPLPFEDSDDPKEVIRYFKDELDRVSVAFEKMASGRSDVLNVAPPKPREGTIAYADGTNWNPGEGAGPYVYKNGAWTPMSTNVPVGAILDWGGAGTIPSGYLAADGSNRSRTTYAALFAKYSTTWGAGDGSTTFGTPDFRRRVAVGSGGSGTGTLGSTVGSTGGEETHALTTAELASHAHSVSGSTSGISANHTHAGSGAWHANVASGRQVVLGGGVFCDLPNVDGSAVQSTGTVSADHTHSFSVTSGSTGSGTAHNNMQPSVVVARIIKT